MMELKKKKPPDLSKLDHNAKAEIGEDVMELKKKKRPLVFGIDYKVLKRLVFGYSAKMITETKSELEEKKLDMFGKFAKIDSKGVTEACITKACVTKACIITEKKRDAENIKANGMPGFIVNKAECKQKLQKKERTGIGKNDTEELRDVIELKKKKPMLFGIDYNVLKMLAFGKKKIKAEKKNVQKQDLARFDHNVQTKIKGG